MSYAPALQRARFAVATAALLGLVLLLALVGTPPAAAAGGTGDAEDVIAQRLADARASAGVPALRRSGDLDGVAREWSRRQAADGRMSHNPNLRDQVQPARSWYENVGTLRGVPSAASYRDAGARLHEMWMGSAAHRANILRTPLTDVGIGVAAVGDEIYATVVFREQSGEATPADPEPAATASTRAPEPAPEPTPAPAPAPEPRPEPAPASTPTRDPEPAATPDPPTDPEPDPEPVTSYHGFPPTGAAAEVDRSWATPTRALPLPAGQVPPAPRDRPATTSDPAATSDEGRGRGTDQVAIVAGAGSGVPASLVLVAGLSVLATGAAAIGVRARLGRCGVGR